jgi:hypothetical protein
VRSTNISDTDVCSRRAALLDLAADGLADPGEPPRRHTGEHPLHHRAGQRVAVGEVLVGLDLKLVLVVGRAHPRTADRNAPATERHRPVLVAVAHRDAVTAVLALGADDLGHLELHQRMHKESVRARPRRSHQSANQRANASASGERRYVGLAWEPSPPVPGRGRCRAARPLDG